MSKSKKICLVASCGGHIMELMQLLPVVEGEEFYFVTEKNVATDSVLSPYRHHFLKQQQRKGKSFPWVFVMNFVLSFFYFIIERPTTVISTGAGAAFPTMKIAKLFGKKIIYVESFAKLNSSSLTGRMVYRFADDFFIQWPELKKTYPRARYAGTVY